MRLNVFIAHGTGLSRRAADKVVVAGRVTINDLTARLGQQVQETDIVKLDNRVITPVVKSTTIMLHKPVGYVCSRDGQGSKTIYDLLPSTLHQLNPIGRLDKDSSGLLLLTNDGQLAHALTHPKFQKKKIYTVALDRTLQSHDQEKIEQGIALDDGLSKLVLQSLSKDRTQWQITMSEGRNRQIRRTFQAIGYNVTRLHRDTFGDYILENLQAGDWQ